MERDSTIGVEIELNLIDAQGYFQSAADSVLGDHRNAGLFVAEGNLAMVEYNSPPASSIAQLHASIVPSLQLLEEICAKYNVTPVSISENGAGAGIQRGGKPRYQAYATILGQEANKQIDTVAGIHAHFSQFKDRLLEQFWVLCALDPLSYALTSTSPIRYDGTNGKNCQRIDTMRNHAFQQFPLHAKLQQYPASIAEIDDCNQQRFDQWQEASGLDGATFAQLFTVQSTGYAPIRKRDNIGPGTWEVRSFDSTPLNIALAAVALYKGVNDQVSEVRSISIADRDDEYQFSLDKIVVPNLATLQRMEKESIHVGIKAESVAQYLGAVLDFAQQGLPAEDKIYVQPIYDTLATRCNPADRIMEYMRSLGIPGEQFLPDQSAKANLFMREQYLRGLH